MLAASMGQSFFYMLLVLLVLTIIPVVWAALAIAVKRLHDLNRSGFWSVLCFLPYLGGLFLLLLGFPRGTQGQNEYGQAPFTVG